MNFVAALAERAVGVRGQVLSGSADRLQVPSGGAFARAGNGVVEGVGRDGEGCGLGAEVDGAYGRARSYSAAGQSERVRKPSASCLATVSSGHRRLSSVAGKKVVRVADPPTQTLRAGIYSSENMTASSTSGTTGDAPKFSTRAGPEPEPIRNSPPAVSSASVGGSLQEIAPEPNISNEACVYDKQEAIRSSTLDGLFTEFVVVL